MVRRWYSLGVVLFWLATMGWLIQQKVLPPLLVGNPPTYRSIVADRGPSDPPAGWQISLAGQPIGWAVSTTQRLESGLTQIRSRIRFARLPLSQLTPTWMQSLFRMLEVDRDFPDLALALNASSNLEIDPLGHLVGFHTKARLAPSLPGAPEPVREGGDAQFNLFLQGVVEGRQLKLTVRSGDFVYDTHTYLPPDALMSDALSPHARLPDLRVGQTWTVPIYSPLRPPNSPLDVLHATVEREEPFVWQSRTVTALVVVFRNDPGSGLSTAHDVQARAWVDADGNVLKQELMLMSARLTFDRMSPDEAQRCANVADDRPTVSSTEP